MAAADITLDATPATIEVSGTQKTYTKSDSTRGVLYNAGSVTCFIHSTAGTVATTDAQALLIVGIPAGVGMPWPQESAAITCKTAGSAGLLYWYPAG